MSKFNLGNMNIMSMSGGSVNINGKQINVPRGSSISMINGVLYVDGKLYEDDGSIEKKGLTIIIQGDVGSVSMENSELSCENIKGNVDGTMINAKNIEGNVRAGSYVECDNVNGDVTAGSYVECDDVHGNVRAGSYVECDYIEGKKM